MASLTKRSKGTPLTIDQTMTPFLGLHKAVDDAMKDFFHVFEPPSLSEERLESCYLLPSMDVVEAKDHFTVEFEMPGMGEEDVEVSINANQLTIKGEKTTSKKHKDKNYLSREIKYGSYERTIDLPTSADTERATASFKKGMLWVKIPKKAGSKKDTHNIKVKKA